MPTEREREREIKLGMFRYTCKIRCVVLEADHQLRRRRRQAGRQTAEVLGGERYVFFSSSFSGGQVLACHRDAEKEKSEAEETRESVVSLATRQPSCV